MTLLIDCGELVYLGQALLSHILAVFYLGPDYTRDVSAAQTLS
jgi:hypothetical protein